MLWHYIYPSKDAHKCGTCGAPADATVVWLDPRMRVPHAAYSHSCHKHLADLLTLILSIQKVYGEKEPT